MPVPATLMSYLPVLLISVTHSAAPDDSSFSPVPDGQVDYLSHEWREEDVWRSWRSMTRQKNAIANGMRLENASWRTWWKQRNKLKTISPETLNWLKDSDVTWLYGPLHVGTDWTPSSHTSEQTLRPRERKTSFDEITSRHELSPRNLKTRPPLTSTVSAPSSNPKKPILKRRSISQLLSLPNSPFFSQGDTDEEEVPEHVHGEESDRAPEDDSEHGRQRRLLLHTKSDTHISSRGRPFRKDSPPRIIAEESPHSPHSPHSVTFASTAEGTSSERSISTGSDQDFSGGSEPNKKRHISFNTFVEQCISIEKPKVKRSGNSSSRLSRVASDDDDGYEEDSEQGYDEEPSSFYLPNQPASNSDSDDDDDDDVLEMRTSSSRSRSSSELQRLNSSTGSLSRRLRPALSRRSSTAGDRVTIAPIAPTLLKTTSDADDLVSDRVTAPSKDVELVYVPSTHNGYSVPSTPSEDVYHHRESYFSVGTHSPHSSSPLAESPPIPSVAVLPPPRYPTSPHPDYATPGHPRMFPKPISDLPQSDAVVEDVFDYFGDSDGEGFTEWSELSRKGGRSRGSVSQAQDEGAEGVTRYAEGGAASVTNGRSSGQISPSHSPETPVVVVNAATGAAEERSERSRESSPSFEYPAVQPYQPPLPPRGDESGSPTFVHTPAQAVPVPRIGTSHPFISFSPQVTDPALLSPPDVGSCRGRLPVCSSVSGSTTTGSSSYSRSSDSRSDSRGRSLTRTSSFSDCERSGSRSSRGTNSPLGSISPTGSGLGIGMPYSRGRERDAKRASKKSDEERGRDRGGRRIGGSASPPSLLGSPIRTADEHAYSPVLSDVPLESVALASSPPSSISGSSTASTSTVAPAPQGESDIVQNRLRVRIVHGQSSIPSIALPSPIPEEEEQRSRQPTPANSPVSALHRALPDVPDRVSQPPQLRRPMDPHPERQPQAEQKSAARSSPGKDRAAHASLDHHEQPGTLVSRAVEMVTSARGFLGAIWNAASS
ncbi:hypothetical protein BKA93DRAFT_828708 [Sparassis latifolia]|uniref:Nitrogen regulatory protein areA GATA-like domain-containing protein n=1 Tax=Sparassis crispa TaxID=139825 RepID=A0A401H544_9APHY|nr:hypothetical protein SCP_1601940 [Sparassis crispa]GBE89532.1 hypothetical protein SCP_1601940 [Sparassis crispa]